MSHEILDEEKWLVGAALQKDQNPAQLLYNLAKIRRYTPKGAAPEAPKPSVNAQRLENIERGQNLNKSVTGGKIAGQDLTDEVLNDIDSYDPFDNLKGKSTLDLMFERMGKRH